MASFLFKKDWNVTEADYSAYFMDPVVQLSLQAACRKALFWSGVSGIVDDFMDVTGELTR